MTFSKRALLHTISKPELLEIELCPDNRSYRSFRLRQSNGEIRVIAELLDVLA